MNNAGTTPQKRSHPAEGDPLQQTASDRREDQPPVANTIKGPTFDRHFPLRGGIVRLYVLDARNRESVTPANQARDIARSIRNPAAHPAGKDHGAPATSTNSAPPPTISTLPTSVHQRRAGIASPEQITCYASNQCLSSP